jgi:PIN domain nuclease of toxin-antitoxin system
MIILLDTQIFLWYISGDVRLPQARVQHIRQPTNLVFVSVASVWETIIKYQLGKLPLPLSPEIYLPAQRRRHQMASLPVDEASLTQLPKLPPLHRDPFDRLLVCQAITYRMTLATVDSAISAYPISLL